MPGSSPRSAAQAEAQQSGLPRRSRAKTGGVPEPSAQPNAPENHPATGLRARTRSADCPNPQRSARPVTLIERQAPRAAPSGARPSRALPLDSEQNVIKRVPPKRKAAHRPSAATRRKRPFPRLAHYPRPRSRPRPSVLIRVHRCLSAVNFLSNCILPAWCGPGGASSVTLVSPVTVVPSHSLSSAPCFPFFPSHTENNPQPPCRVVSSFRFICTTPENSAD